MLVAEYDYDTDIAVQREESLRIGIQQGIKQGIQQGIQQGFSDGTYQAKREMVKTMLTMGYLLDDICKIAGLSKADVAALQ